MVIMILIIRTSDFIARSDIAHVTCSTDTDSRMTCSKKQRLVINCVQLQGFPITLDTIDEWGKYYHKRKYCYLQ